MLSASTARFVEDAMVLGQPEIVCIKGSDSPVVARHLLAKTDEPRPTRHFSILVGRDWEFNTIAGILDQAISGRGRVVGLVGPPGIGKSRLVLEATSIAARRGVEVFTTYCESHTSDIPFHVATRLLREALSISGLDDDEARVTIRSRMPDAEPEDLMLLDDLLGVSDPDISLAAIDPDARTRRLTALLNAAAIARKTPAVFVIEDAHWIDQTSEAMFADFAAVVPQTHVLILVTYRPNTAARSTSHRVRTVFPLPRFGIPTPRRLSPSCWGQALRSHRSSRRLPSGQPVIHSSPRRSFATSLSAVWLPAKAGAFVSQHDAANVRVPASLQSAIAIAEAMQ